MRRLQMIQRLESVANSIFETTLCGSADRSPQCFGLGDFPALSEPIECAHRFNVERISAFYGLYGHT